MSPATAYGLVGKARVPPGKGDESLGILLDGAGGLAGCFSCVVVHDATDPAVVWVTGVCIHQDAHRASLSLPRVREPIAHRR